MNPEEIAAYADKLWDAFKARAWSNDYTMRMIEVALREKLRQAGARGCLTDD